MFLLSAAFLLDRFYSNFGDESIPITYCWARLKTCIDLRLALVILVVEIRGISNVDRELTHPSRKSLRGPKLEGGIQMFRVSLRLLPSRFIKLSCLTIGLIAFCAAPAFRSYAQKAEEPLFSDFKGVRIGTPTDEARKKLGNPKDKGDEQDFYTFGDNQVVQVYYDKTTKTVTAISIDFLNGANPIPAAKEVIGSDIDAKADGSGYKMVRYPKAGYWVSYSRTAGKEPTITITMQKIDH